MMKPCPLCLSYPNTDTHGEGHTIKCVGIDHTLSVTDTFEKADARWNALVEAFGGGGSVQGSGTGAIRECAHCSAMLKDESAAREHQRWHDLLLPIPLKCDACSASVRGELELRAHREWHKQQETAASLLECEQCSAVIKGAPAMRVHMEWHKDGQRRMEGVDDKLKWMADHQRWHEERTLVTRVMLMHCTICHAAMYGEIDHAAHMAWHKSILPEGWGTEVKLQTASPAAADASWPPPLPEGAGPGWPEEVKSGKLVIPAQPPASELIVPEEKKPVACIRCGAPIPGTGRGFVAMVWCNCTLAQRQEALANLVTHVAETLGRIAKGLGPALGREMGKPEWVTCGYQWASPPNSGQNCPHGDAHTCRLDVVRGAPRHEHAHRCRCGQELKP